MIARGKERGRGMGGLVLSFDLSLTIAERVSKGPKERRNKISRMKGRRQ
jgi:hypothetical protein